MALSHMAAKDEDALICDFAQYYGVTDFRALKPSYAAVLAVGLPEDARIKKKLHDQQLDLKTMLLARIADYLAIDVWFQTKDGHKGRNRPPSIAKILSGGSDQVETGEYKVFATAEAFEAERRRILGNG